MRLADLRIIEASGCVVEGRFGLESPHAPDGDPIPGAGGLVSLSLRGGTLMLSELEQMRPGIWTRANSEFSLSLSLPAAVDLERLLSDMLSSPLEPGPRWVEWAGVFSHSAFGSVSGRIACLEIEARVLEAGVGVTFRGDVGPMTKTAGLLEPPVEVQVLADSRLHADIVIPWAYLIVQQSRLAYLGNKFHAPGEYGAPLFGFDPVGLAGVAFDRSSGDPMFPGPFTLRRGGSSPCVRLRDFDDVLTLDACGTPRTYPDGFVSSNLSGPSLALFGMGPGVWPKLLGGEKSASLELKGDCVGFLTEASILGAVAGRHAISAYRIDLALGESELVLKITGEVDRLLRYDGPPLPPTLGPRFEVTARIQAEFLAVRGVDLVRWGADQKRLLRGESFH
jgi:hypothetical protein